MCALQYNPLRMQCLKSTVSPLSMTFEHERWRLREPFRITGCIMEELEVVLVRLEDGDGNVGFGEAAGVDYLPDGSLPSVIRQLEQVRSQVETGLDLEQLQSILPPGGARNALDCALWDLTARRSGSSVWQLASLPAPHALLTTYTIGAADPQGMADRAKGFASARAIKLKLLGEPADIERVRAVRAQRPEVWLGVDANQGCSREHFRALLPTLIQERVSLIEQPFKVGEEPLLAELDCPIPVAADESIQCLADMTRLRGRFDVVNIKLDKCGGLTEALAMARQAPSLGYSVMVGNMVGTSLAMAPAFMVGQLCQVVDLDGPILLLGDRAQRASYVDGRITCGSEVWGGGGSQAGTAAH